MKKIFSIFALACAFNLGAMEQQPTQNLDIIEANVCLFPETPQYAGWNTTSELESGRGRTQEALEKEISPDTLLQPIWVWDPQTMNDGNSQYPFLNKKGEWVNRVPAYLPLELLPKKEGETVELTLRGTKFKLTGNQNGNRYNGIRRNFGHSKLELTRDFLLNKALKNPNVNKKDIPGLIAMGTLKRRWHWFGKLVPGPNNRYFKEDKTALYSLAGAGIAALGLFAAWWNR